MATGTLTSRINVPDWLRSNPYAHYYPQDWPSNPFHDGEVFMQKKEKVHERVMSYAPRVIRPYMPEQHVDFYVNQPFLVAAARDQEGNMWSTFLMNEHGNVGFLTSPDLATLAIDASPFPGDVLYNAFEKMGSTADVGLLGIELATKRRNRVNGVVSRKSENGPLMFYVTQSFGNCPQYIKQRQWWTEATSSTRKTTRDACPRSYAAELSNEQINRVQSAETIFVATGYRGEGDDARFGNDASHRGGPAGFVIVKDGKTLILPEFSGNNHFNSLGNLILDTRMGISFPSFENGGMLQLSGRAEVDLDKTRASEMYPGALRLITFHIERVNDIEAGTFPLRWNVPQDQEHRRLQVTSIVQESANIKSFYFSPLDDGSSNTELWNFTAGQHLPIRLRTCRGEVLRTYSLSGAPDNQGHYRISVKREEFGAASTFLHDHMNVGDMVEVARPAGDFILKNDAEEDDAAAHRTVVLLSSGVGVTPILSMLHQFVNKQKLLKSSTKRKAVWIHGTRDGGMHAFADEVKQLKQQANANNSSVDLTTHVVYSQPREEDTTLGIHDSTGRINLNLIKNLVSDISNAEFFMCGPGAMTAEVEEHLQAAGVDANLIHYETF
jgi:ferredoxin-NADP reductase/predicted pyridoxine 5'-phosphate oxidase superfamily flavin-nucleotide-binding protein